MTLNYREMNRRNFLRNSAATTLGIAGINKLPEAAIHEKFKTIRIGICADLHQDIMHDGPQRIAAFIEAMNVQRPDFIIQLGDFCIPYERNNVILNIWNRFPGPKFHVIGNHDTDGGFTCEQVVSFWKAIGKYYSFDMKGYHFVILDGNEKNPSPDRPPGYARYISDEQLHWLEADLDKTTFPVIIFCHQGLDNDMGGIENATQSRLVLERANAKANFSKVQIVFSGHHHLDYHNIVNGIHYIQINSMSYQWLGEKYQHLRYSEDVDKAHPNIKETVPYKDPLWAVVDIHQDGSFTLQGRKSAFVGPSPIELGMPRYEYGYPIVPVISNRQIKLTMNSSEDTVGILSSST
jgi:3',5'-cyclic AMP phosphodiesterase CpdA